MKLSIPQLLSTLVLSAIVLVGCAQGNTPTSVPSPTQPALPTATPQPALPTPTIAPEATQPAPSDSLVTFVLLPEESKASYSIDEVFINQNNRLFTAVGITSEIEGQMQLNYAAPTSSRFGLFTVNISTLTSDSSRRDNAIRSNWLESSKYPLATFLVTEVKNFPENPQEGQDITFQLLGDLTIRETTLPITWDVTARLEGDRLIGSATTLILLVDFDVEPPSIAGVLTVTDGATLKLEFVLEAQR